MSEYDHEEAGRVSSEPSRRFDESGSDTGLHPDDLLHIRQSIADVLDLSRRDETRSMAAEILVEQLCPRDIDPIIWMRWLQGAEHPFSAPDLVSPAPKNEAPGAALQRRSKTLNGLEQEFRQAEVEVVKAQDYLREAVAKAEKQLAKLHDHRAKEQALLLYMVSKHVRKNAEAIFAMGPAWIIMRAASSHLSNEVLALLLAGTSEDKHHAQKARLRKERVASSAMILQTLDTMSGDATFEASLHDALRDFCLTFSEQLALRNRRSASAAKASVASTALRQGMTSTLAGVLTPDPSSPYRGIVSQSWDGDFG